MDSREEAVGAPATEPIKKVSSPNPWVGTTDESDSDLTQQPDARLGDRYCTDCEIQFKSFKTFKVRIASVTGTRAGGVKFALCFLRPHSATPAAGEVRVY